VNEQDFEQMVKLNYPRIRRAALLLSNGNSWDADDLTQETLLQAARGWSRFQGKSQAGTWLYSILIRQHRQRHRSDRRLWQRWLHWFEGNRGNRSPVAPDNRLLAEEWQAKLWSTVATLPGPQQEVIVLRYAEELTYEEIAKAVNCPIGTVKSRLYNGLETLERLLKDREIAIPR